MTPERKAQVLQDLSEMLDQAATAVRSKAAWLLDQQESLLTRADEEAGGPMTTPKDLLTALLLREAAQYSPTYSFIDIKGIQMSSPATKRSLKVIKGLRAAI